jgi:hypothetical protein
MKKRAIIGFLLCSFLAVTSAHAGDAFIKAGLHFFNNDEYEDLNSFIFAAGADWRLVDYFSLGFDIQYSTKSQNELRHHFVNGYINAKAYLGKEFIRPFVGAGLGYQVAGLWSEEANLTITNVDYSSAPGYQILGGVLIGKPGGISFVAEFQYKKATGDLEGLDSYALLGGIVF